MEMTNQVYGQMVNEFSKESPKVKDSVLAFAVGGGICVIGQILKNVYTAWGVSEQDAGIWVTITLIFLSALFTGLKLYDKLAKYAGAGTLVPVTGDGVCKLHRLPCHGF